MGRLEGHQRDLHLLRLTIPPRELVPQPAVGAVQRARHWRAKRHGPADRYRVPLPVGVIICRGGRCRRFGADPLPPRSGTDETRLDVNVTRRTTDALRAEELAFVPVPIGTVRPHGAALARAPDFHALHAAGTAEQVHD